MWRGEGGAHPAIDTGQRPRQPVHGAQRPPPTTDNLTHICALTAAPATAASDRAAAMAASFFRVQDKLVDMSHKRLNEFEFSSTIVLITGGGR